MSRPRIDVFERAVQKADQWIDDLMDRMGWDDRHQTYEAMGAVLHVLRDRLPVNEAVDLGAQLPLLLRGLFYQNWNVSVNPEKYRHADEFLRHVRAALLDLRLEFIPEETLIEGVAGLLGDRLSEGEMAGIRRALPSEIRGFFSAVDRGRAP
jgi:uncharacterized protein (DUF2267 family)